MEGVLTLSVSKKCKNEKDRFTRLSKSAVRAICHVPPWTLSAPLFTRLNLHTPHACIQVKQLSICCRSLHGLASPLCRFVLCHPLPVAQSPVVQPTKTFTAASAQDKNRVNVVFVLGTLSPSMCNTILVLLLSAVPSLIS